MFVKNQKVLEDIVIVNDNVYLNKNKDLLI